MTTNRQKMYKTNGLVRKKLIEMGFIDIFFFPHLRFSKDYHINGLGFDAIAWKKEGESSYILYLFQIKTNCKPSKETLEAYYKAEKLYNCRLCWITKTDGKLYLFNANSSDLKLENKEI